MTQFYAQPYDISSTGFYFESMEEYDTLYSKNLNEYGEQPEEYEIQFIDGEEIDCKLFNALGVHQGNIHHFIEKIEEWEEHQKHALIIATGECGYNFDIDSGNPDDFDIELYELDSLKELAEQFIEEGLFGQIPDNIRFYLDTDAIARDLGMDYSETRIDGTNYIYRMA
ncbi:MAG: antirestriction protein ArdA [Alphaproteobacteria bacterium CG11_big_fil_rev_8_21_14_0_20_39_49]|nr:MAG: antirestriction protein ArdA [Alphaproteobacteria bacterium CG11_big_fil_rev_8_21_14_0_20_39_49]